MASDNFTPYDVVTAEGRRIGLMTCLRCGALVLVNDEGPAIHDQWHRNQEEKADA